jgi:CheY-like chemotaxis protein
MSTQEHVWDWRSTNALWSAQAAASGLSLSPDEDQPSSSGFHANTAGRPELKAKPARCILIVEDSASDVLLIRQSLQEHEISLDVVVMRDGERAERFLDDVDAGTPPCPAIVILDLNLPKRTGLEVLQRIRQSSTCRDVPVVVFSSSDATRDKQAAQSLGANRYIRKPSNLDGFLQIGGVLKELLGEGTT